MHRQLPLLALVMSATLSQGCATTDHPDQVLTTATRCRGPECRGQTLLVANKIEVPVEKDAPAIAGHPLTSVVVTQCNLIVAVYMTMPDGKLLRFDNKASVPADELIQMAYSATRSERVEVACDDGSGGLGAVGFEKHEPV